MSVPHADVLSSLEGCAAEAERRVQALEQTCARLQGTKQGAVCTHESHLNVLWHCPVLYQSCGSFGANRLCPSPQMLCRLVLRTA